MPRSYLEKWKESTVGSKNVPALADREPHEINVVHLWKVSPRSVVDALHSPIVRRMGRLPVTVHSMGRGEVAVYHFPWTESSHVAMFDSLREIAHRGGGAVAAPIAFVRYPRPAQQKLVVSLPRGSIPLAQLLDSDASLEEKQTACRRAIRRVALLDATGHSHHALRPSFFAISEHGRPTLLHFSGLHREEYRTEHRSSDMSFELATALHLHGKKIAAPSDMQRIEKIAEWLRGEYRQAYARYRKKLVELAAHRKSRKARPQP